MARSASFALACPRSWHPLARIVAFTTRAAAPRAGGSVAPEGCLLAQAAARASARQPGARRIRSPSHTTCGTARVRLACPGRAREACAPMARPARAPLHTALRTLALSCIFALGLALACGSTGGSGSSGGGSACTDYFDSLFSSGCVGGVRLPAGELARIRPRFAQACEFVLGLPGIGLTAQSLEGCVSERQSPGCASSGTACALGGKAGALAPSLPCVSDEQCQSGRCSAGNSGADGGTVVCGTCTAAAEIGQPCTGACADGGACVFNGGAGTCVAVTHGGAGAPCDSFRALCASGLVCTAARTCEAPGAAGATCRFDQDCQSPLVCPTHNVASTCQNPGPAGTACSQDGHCASGLGCDANTYQCATITWASAGQPCSGSARCLVGDCPYANNQAAGSCPAVVSDGQPCTVDSTCDTFASCVEGVCRLTQAGLCP